MIDLGATRAQLLAEIGATRDGGGAAFEDPIDPRLLDGDEVRLRVHGHARDDLFPVLAVVLSARFAGVSRSERNRELLAPLKNALGNAYKHGNRRDRSRRIEVELSATHRGALVAVRDQGEGFDPGRQLALLRAGKCYYANHGVGLRTLDRIRSRVAWEDGGRTLLLRFVPECVDASAAGRASERTPRSHPLRAKEPDAARIQAALGESLSHWPGSWAHVESCRVYAQGADGGATPGVRCVLRGRGAGASEPELLVVSGKLLASGAEARAELEVARALQAGVRAKEVRIPRALAEVDGEPRLALFAFQPWMDLFEYAAERGDARAIRRAASRVGTTLRAVHEDGIRVPVARWGDVLGRERARWRRTLASLAALDPVLAERARLLCDELARRAASIEPPEPASVHGAFGWDRIHYGVDGRFYLDGFAGFRRSHPGLDLGGFLADALRSCATDRDDDLARATCEDFLGAWSAGDPAPLWQQDLSLFATMALLERADRVLRGAEPRTSDVDAILELGERTLRGGLWVWP